jgi:hypothetical protein
MQADAQKAADHNGYDQTIRPSVEKGAGLKIRCPVPRVRLLLRPSADPLIVVRRPDSQSYLPHRAHLVDNRYEGASLTRPTTTRPMRPTSWNATSGFIPCSVW